MAKNLQAKLQPADRLAVFDINPDALAALDADVKASSGRAGAELEMAASAFDAAKDAVSCPASTPAPPL